MAVNLKSRSARQALKPRREPYWMPIRKGVYLGFRRVDEGDGTWIGRMLRADAGERGLKGSGAYVSRSLGTYAEHADALADLNAWAGGIDQGVTHKAITVADACRSYVKERRATKGVANSADADGRFRRLVYEAPIGSLRLDKLRTTDLRDWVNAQLDEDGDDDDLRRSKDSANRNLAALKAALNLAHEDGLVATDAGWRTVVPFVNVGRRRELYLTREDRAKLLEKCEPDLRTLVTGLLLTAARPGELASCTVADFDRSQGTLALAGKTGRRIVAVSTAAASFLTDQSKGKLPSAPLLATAYGTPWVKDGWKDRLKAAVRAAGLPEATVAYSLRHCAISELIMAGVDSMLVAKVAGTSVAMIERNYLHLRTEHTRARLDVVQMI